MTDALQRWDAGRVDGRPLLSAVLFVGNEAATLRRTLASLRPLAPEVIVAIDARSSDLTEVIARDFAHHLITVDFDGDFATARNQALKHATGIWCLSIDGHEYFEPDSAATLAGLLSVATEEGSEGPGAVALLVRLGPEEGNEVGLAIRVWRHGPDVRYERPVHEQLVGLTDPVIGRPDIVIEHRRSPEAVAVRRRQRMADDLRVLQDYLADEPRDAPAALHIAELLDKAGRVAEAIAFCSLALTNSDAKRSVFRARAHCLLAKQQARAKVQA